jgi:hypothetical protein
VKEHDHGADVLDKKHALRGSFNAARLASADHGNLLKNDCQKSALEKGDGIVVALQREVARRRF